MQPLITTAGARDEALVLELMREFYAVEHLPFDEAVARRALGELWADPRLGLVLLLHDDADPIGYLVLAYGFSLEFHGRDALVDELYVRESHRGRGAGAAALGRVEEICAAEGVRAVHLEVDHVNHRAKALYLRHGYRDHDRHLLTKWLPG
jgi:GNAT superfamily N-acetyltransferase